MIRTPLTYEQIVDSYEFKVVSKLLRKEYPWIKKVEIDRPSLSEYNMIFLEIQVDYELFSEYYDVELRPYPKKLIEQGEGYDSPFLNLLFTFDDRDIAAGILENINDLANSVRKSPALPQDLKLPKERVFAVGLFYI